MPSITRTEPGKRVAKYSKNLEAQVLQKAERLEDIGFREYLNTK